MHVHFCVAGAACVGECVCIKVCLNRAGRLHGVLAGRIVTWWPRRGKKLAEKTVSLLPDWLMLPINSSINKNTKRKSALLSIWGICCLIRSMFIMKRKHTKNPTYLVYSPPSMTWQHRQGKSVQQIANNMLPGLAKETVSSRSPPPPNIYKYREQRHLQWSMLVGSCWFSAMLRHSRKPWQWDFRTGIRLLFSPRGTVGYFNNERNTDTSLHLLCFF